MKNELFNDLLKSMHEMDRIVQGELAPGRVTRFTEPEVKQIRMNTGLSQKKPASLLLIRYLKTRSLSLSRKIKLF